MKLLLSKSLGLLWLIIRHLLKLQSTLKDALEILYYPETWNEFRTNLLSCDNSSNKYHYGSLHDRMYICMLSLKWLWKWFGRGSRKIYTAYSMRLSRPMRTQSAIPWQVKFFGIWNFWFAKSSKFCQKHELVPSEKECKFI